jgi:hypothetical protein
LGRGEAFRRIGFSYEASYRYGRIGYPLLGWVLALGHPPRDTLRVLMVPQVLGLVCAVCASSRSSVPAMEDDALVTALAAATA